MSVELVLNDGPLFAQVTPAGAFYAVASLQPDRNREVLLRVLHEGAGSPLTREKAREWTQTDDLDGALRIFFRLQRLGLIRGAERPVPPNRERLEDILPDLLARLSDQGKAVLADDNGFYLAAAGYPHEAAEELAGLAGDLLALQERHSRLVRNNLRIGTDAWALVDPAGRSELGFWPLFIGKQSFMLIIGETPRLQSQEFVTLVQVLDQRYR